MSDENSTTGESSDLPISLEPTSVDLLAAALRADTNDLSTYERVLVGTLSSVLPEGMIEIVRDRSLSDRLSGRPGAVTAINAHFGEVTLELTSRRGRFEALFAKTVRGVVITRKEITFEEWTTLFARELARVAAEHAAARAALERFLQQS